MTMTAIERYEQTWNRFLLRIDEDPSVTLISIQKENHVNISGMSRWMTEHGLSATESKKILKVYQQKTSAEIISSCTDTGERLFLPVRVDDDSLPDDSQNKLRGISFVFPDGTQMRIKEGSARAVMSFLKLYNQEDTSC